MSELRYTVLTLYKLSGSSESRNRVESEEVGFSYLETMLRLGQKYEIANFKTMALERLRRLFPRHMHEWEEATRWHSELNRFWGKPTSKGLLFDVVNAAYQGDLGIPSILPTAFLFLCMKHSLVCPNFRRLMSLFLNFFVNLQEEIISGVKRSDQSLAILPPEAMRAALYAEQLL